MKFFLAIIIIWIFLRTFSYGKWTWSKKNKLGGAMVILLAFASASLMVYWLFFKQ